MTDSNADEKLVLVPLRPGAERRSRLLTWLAIFIAIGGSGVLGFYAARAPLQQLEARVESLQERTQLAEAEREEAVLTMLQVQQDEQVNQAARETALAQLRELQTANENLRQTVAFYEEIMAPGTRTDGLQISGLTLTSLPGNLHFAYKLVLMQLSEKHDLISGPVTLTLEGRRNGEITEVPVPLGGGDPPAVQGAFRFRYFQNFEGEFELPEGFSPSRLRVSAQAGGKKATKIDRVFLWQPRS